MFHEIIRGYLRSSTTIRGELNSHIEMANSYVNKEINALQEVFPNLSLHDASCLVIGGYADIQGNDPATFAQV